MRVSAESIFMMLLQMIGLLFIANSIGLLMTFYFGHSFVYGLVPLFNFDTERNFPTFYSALQLLFASFLLAVIGGSRKLDGKQFMFWFILAGIFLFMAFDELFLVHERFNVPGRRNYGLDGIFHFAWVIPYGVATIGLGLFFLRFILSLPKKTMRLFILSGSTFLAGAIGFEMLGGLSFSNDPTNLLRYALITTCEELLEMIGIAVFIYSLLAYASVHEVSLSVSAKN